MSSRTHASVPAAFARALEDLRSVVWRPELSVEEIPSPQRIAPFAVAISADVVVAGEEIGSGRLVLLHDPAGNDAWNGDFRCVAFAKAEVEPEMVRDPLLADVGWSWLEDALAARHAEFIEPSGTVTAVVSTPFGDLAAADGSAEVEIRASWTPVLNPQRRFFDHAQAWQDLMCTVAGLPPITAGVTPIQPRRVRR